jgi:hypothetical protein
VADALERVTGLKSLNGCGDYAAIRAGGLQKMALRGMELGVWAGRFLERSARTLTKLDVRCRYRVDNNDTSNDDNNKIITIIYVINM